MTQDEIIEWLVDHDNRFLDLGENTRVGMLIESDDDASINDYEECYGKVAEGPRRMGGHAPRPDGFDGNAEKLWYGNYGPWWWQPPEGTKRGTKEFSELRSLVAELLGFGFYVVSLQLQTRCDQGHWHTVNAAALGGIDSVDRTNLIYIVGGLLDDLDIEHLYTNS